MEKPVKPAHKDAIKDTDKPHIGQHLKTEETTPAKPAPKKSDSGFSEVVKTIGGIGSALVAAILLVVFVFQSYQVSGSSMQNTLQDGNRMIVWKLPRSWSRLTGHAYIPKRGDIIIVNQQNLSACDQSGKQIIKRVIGLPGDRVTYKDGKYKIYNSQYPQGFDPDTTLAYGKAGTPLFADSQNFNINVTLKANQLFVGGDHRADSCDSRFFGPIDANQIIGKLVLRILPVKQLERF